MKWDASRREYLFSADIQRENRQSPVFLGQVLVNNLVRFSTLEFGLEGSFRREALNSSPAVMRLQGSWLWTLSVFLSWVISLCWQNA